MKVCIIGDVHWSTYSSIVRSRGTYFSTRLHYLINSLNWVEQISKQYGCTEEIFLGDFFDKEDVDAESLTALSEIEWNSSSRLKHFIVGNHESGLSSLVYNSTQALHKIGVIEDKPCIYPLDDKTEFLFLPYITEDNRKPLEDYLKDRNPNKKIIVFSHNDLKNFQMGPFCSTTGFDIDEICQLTDLYVNGHLHNGAWVKPLKLLNLGVICGQNFSEDAFKYGHHIAILDTDTLNIEFIENPYALNFYKLDINHKSEINQLKSLKDNAVVSIKCNEKLRKDLEAMLSSCQNIVMHKVCYVCTDESGNITTNIEALQLVDHLERFKAFVIDKLGNTSVVQAELGEVCK